jgi:uncharacterized protein
VPELDLIASGQGVNLRVRVTPRASRSAIAGVSDGALLVRLSAPPVDGAANAALVEFLADALGVRRSQVSLLRGATSRIKVVHIDGATAEELRMRWPG